MSEQIWNFVDKSKWPTRGEWDAEPDKVQWIDAATGFDCLIHRGPSGALCGYVGLPPGHKYHGADYNAVEIPHPERDDSYPDVHGGLTYADKCSPPRADGSGVCHIAAEGRPDDVWWLGFDCAHSGDMCPSYDRFDTYGAYRRLDYVKREVASLAKQLASVSA